MSEAKATRTAIEGRLTYNAREIRYMLNGRPLFAQLATLIGLDMPSRMAEYGRDMGRVRITIEVIEDGAEDDE